MTTALRKHRLLPRHKHKCPMQTDRRVDARAEQRCSCSRLMLMLMLYYLIDRQLPYCTSLPQPCPHTCMCIDVYHSCLTGSGLSSRLSFARQLLAYPRDVQPRQEPSEVQGATTPVYPSTKDCSRSPALSPRTRRSKSSSVRTRPPDQPRFKPPSTPSSRSNCPAGLAIPSSFADIRQQGEDLGRPQHPRPGRHHPRCHPSLRLAAGLERDLILR